VEIADIEIPGRVVAARKRNQGQGQMKDVNVQDKLGLLF
jgi:hypothetical protein